MSVSPEKTCEEKTSIISPYVRVRKIFMTKIYVPNQIQPRCSDKRHGWNIGAVEDTQEPTRDGDKQGIKDYTKKSASGMTLVQGIKNIVKIVQQKAATYNETYSSRMCS